MEGFCLNGIYEFLGNHRGCMVALSVRGLNYQHFKPVSGRLQSLRVVASRPTAIDIEMVLDDTDSTVHSISKVE